MIRAIGVAALPLTITITRATTITIATARHVEATPATSTAGAGVEDATGAVAITMAGAVGAGATGTTLAATHSGGWFDPQAAATGGGILLDLRAVPASVAPSRPGATSSGAMGRQVEGGRGRAHTRRTAAAAALGVEEV